jgi:hypothetical protein
MAGAENSKRVHRKFVIVLNVSLTAAVCVDESGFHGQEVGRNRECASEGCRPKVRIHQRNSKTKKVNVVV